MTPGDLVEIEQIKQLKYRYMRCLDQKLWDEVGGCFTEDVETHYENGHYRYQGIDEVMRFLSESLEGLRRGGRWGVHLGHHPEIELLSDSEARGLWTLHSAGMDRGTGRASRQDSFYEDDYRRTAEGWRICRTGYKSFTSGSWQATDLALQVGAESDSRSVNARARSQQEQP